MFIRKMLMVATAALVAGGPAARALEITDGERWDCLRTCRADARLCVQATRTDVRLCTQSTCGNYLTVARETCASAEAGTSENCRTARQTARACVRDCRESLGPALSACRSEAGDCVGRCPAAEPSPDPVPRDPACAMQCRDGLGTCAEPLKAAGSDCRASCQDALDQARQTCSPAPRSAECATARRKAFDCVRPCDEALGAGLRNCLNQVPGCLRSCSESSSL